MGMELGRLVEQRRHELELSRRDLAERSDVSYPYLSQIESGDRDPSLKTLGKLADALSLPVSQLASMVSPESWVASGSLPPGSDSIPRASYGESTDLYREKVLPSVRRKLQSIPPLMRLELLAELTGEAAREAVEQRD